MSVRFVNPTPFDLTYIANTMRSGDIDEVWASHNATPFEALKISINASEYCVVALADDEPVAVFGLIVRDMLTGTGCPWLLGSESVKNYRRELLEYSPQVVSEMLEICPRLYNYVDVRNKPSIRWLKWLGFEFEPATPYGVEGLPFHRFYRTRGH